MMKMKKIKIVFSACLTVLLYIAWASPVYGQASKSPIVQEIRKYVNDSCSYFEVTEDFFNSLEGDERINGELKEYVSKLQFIIYIECPHTFKGFYSSFENTPGLKEFKTMMVSKNVSENYSFLKREKQGLKEYLLFHDRGAVYIAGSLDVRTIADRK